jgi:hypothetical protein
MASAWSAWSSLRVSIPDFEDDRPSDVGEDPTEPPRQHEVRWGVQAQVAVRREVHARFDRAAKAGRFEVDA